MHPFVLYHVSKNMYNFREYEDFFNFSNVLILQRLIMN